MHGSNLKRQENLLSVVTCIPPTELFNPTLSKGLTVGFAPIPITICTMKREMNCLSYQLAQSIF